MTDPEERCGEQNPDYPGEYYCEFPKGHGPIREGDINEDEPESDYMWDHAAPHSGVMWNMPDPVTPQWVHQAKLDDIAKMLHDAHVAQFPWMKGDSLTDAVTWDQCSNCQRYAGYVADQIIHLEAQVRLWQGVARDSSADTHAALDETEKLNEENRKLLRVLQRLITGEDISRALSAMVDSGEIKTDVDKVYSGDEVREMLGFGQEGE